MGLRCPGRKLAEIRMTFVISVYLIWCRFRGFLLGTSWISTDLPSQTGRSDTGCLLMYLPTICHLDGEVTKPWVKEKLKLLKG